jgi:hypothetical protein
MEYQRSGLMRYSMEAGVGGAWYVIIPRMVAGVSAVGVFWSGVVVETGVAMGVSQPASVRTRLVTRISQKTEEKCFRCFIFYSFIYIPIIAFTQKKSPPEGRGLSWSSGQVLEQAL